MPVSSEFWHRSWGAVSERALDWSSGSIEGSVNRIKKIKRQLYGRDGFELLRKMILLR
ncbi:hypothetical protein ABGT92_08075 [Streptomyces cinereoruber]|uniref:hypothetical protein n=1 Tax=Streptomyces cinereoruber TaxID=67260 RepID=UPI00345CC3E5